MSMAEPDDCLPEPDERDVRAATESMVVVKEAPGIFVVYSGANGQYIVDARDLSCECDDFKYRFRENDRRCKHLRRIEMTVGVRDIPDGVAPDPVLLKQRASDQHGD